MSYEALDDRDGKQNGTIADHEAPPKPAMRVSSSSSVVSSASGASFLRRQQPEALAEPLTGGDVEEGVEDPFFVFRGDLVAKLDLVDESLAEFLRVVHQTDTAVNTIEFKDAKKQLKRHLKNAESTLQDIQMTLQLVQVDRDHSISDQELYDRQSFVGTATDRIRRAKQESHSQAVKAKVLADERAKAVRRAGSMGASNGAQQENTNFIVDSQARTSLLMQHQDETLDELDVAVTRVGHMADNIHQEIGQQGKMLDELTEDLDNVEEELGLVMGKLAKFLQTKDRWQLGTILALTGVMMVLILLVLYT